MISLRWASRWAASVKVIGASDEAVDKSPSKGKPSSAPLDRVAKSLRENGLLLPKGSRALPLMLQTFPYLCDGVEMYI